VGNIYNLKRLYSMQQTKFTCYFCGKEEQINEFDVNDEVLQLALANEKNIECCFDCYKQVSRDRDYYLKYRKGKTAWRFE